MSMDLDHCLIRRLFAKPTAIDFWSWTGVGGCACPIFANVLRSATAVIVLLDMATPSASGAAASVLCMIVDVLRMAPFRTSG
jgi:hypothetical protein